MWGRTADRCGEEENSGTQCAGGRTPHRAHAFMCWSSTASLRSTTAASSSRSMAADSRRARRRGVGPRAEGAHRAGGARPPVITASRPAAYRGDGDNAGEAAAMSAPTTGAHQHRPRRSATTRPPPVTAPAAGLLSSALINGGEHGVREQHVLNPRTEQPRLQLPP